MIWYLLNPDHTVSTTNYMYESFQPIEERRVAREEVGDVEVSTVFLSHDHNWTGEGDPILFETMVFGGEWDGMCDRYHTYDQALAGHRSIVEKIERGENPWEPS